VPRGLSGCLPSTVLLLPSRHSGGTAGHPPVSQKNSSFLPPMFFSVFSLSFYHLSQKTSRAYLKIVFGKYRKNSPEKIPSCSFIFYSILCVHVLSRQETAFHRSHIGVFRLFICFPCLLCTCLFPRMSLFVYRNYSLFINFSRSSS